MPFGVSSFFCVCACVACSMCSLNVPFDSTAVFGAERAHVAEDKRCVCVCVSDILRELPTVVVVESNGCAQAMHGDWR